MSSTNRGGQRSADDYYSTPAWAVDALLKRVGPLAGKRILEPSAGTGAIVRRLLAHGADDLAITAVEIDPDRALTLRRNHGFHVVQAPFELWGRSGFGYDLIVMNPPFSAAQEHIERAISLLAPGGLCCALERLSFGASKKRAGLRAKHAHDKLELASRPSFTAEALAAMTEADLLDARIGDETIEDVRRRLRGTDSADYAWFCFGTWPAGAAVPWGDLHKPSRCGGHFMVLEDGP